MFSYKKTAERAHAAFTLRGDILQHWGTVSQPGYWQWRSQDSDGPRGPSTEPHPLPCPHVHFVI